MVYRRLREVQLPKRRLRVQQEWRLREGQRDEGVLFQRQGGH